MVESCQLPRRSWPEFCWPRNVFAGTSRRGDVSTDAGRWRWALAAVPVALFGLSLSNGPAAGQTCDLYPYTLANGQTADANQVMANFNYALSCVNGLRGYIGGLTLSNNSGSPQTTINTASGVAASDDATTLMRLAAFTKNANAAWAVGSGNGCLATGSSLSNNMWYHVFVIARTDTGVVDQLCSTSLSPTLPTSYTKKRRIGSFRTNSSAQILQFRQNADEFLWMSPFYDVNAQYLPSAQRGEIVLSVPTGVVVNALITVQIMAPTSIIGFIRITSLDVDDNMIGPVDLLANPTQYAAGQYNARTDINGKIGVRGSDPQSHYWVKTLGWIDTRGRFD